MKKWAWLLICIMAFPQSVFAFGFGGGGGGGGGCVKSADCSTVIGAGQCCVNTTTGVLYGGNGSSAVAQGSTVVNGSKWYNGSGGAPSAGTGVNGDYSLRTDTGDVYNKSAGSWSLIGNIKGATGATGPTGATGATGSTGSAATIAVGTVMTGAAGSSVVVTNGGTSSAASFNFTIPRGNTGDTGAKGDKGDTGAAGTGFTSCTPGNGDCGITSTNSTISPSASALGATDSTKTAIAFGPRGAVQKCYSGSCSSLNSGTIGGSTGSTDLAVQVANGTGGSTVKASVATIDANGVYSAPKVSGTPGQMGLYGGNSTDTYIWGLLGPSAAMSETVWFQPTATEPAGQVMSWAAPSGTGGPGSTKVSAGTWITPCVSGAACTGYQATLTNPIVAGTMGTTGQMCTKNAATNTIDCNTAVPGGGNVSNSGTPTQYQWPQWNSATVLTGNTVTANHPVCAGTNSVPQACTNLTDVAIPTGTFASQSYGSTAVGDILIGGTSGVPTGKVADVAVGQVLVSGGVGAVPSYSASPSVTSVTTVSSDTETSITSTSTGTGNINLDGVSASDYNYSNGSSTATYTPVFTSLPASGYVRYITATFGGGSGVDTMTWTNVNWIGTAGASATTTNKKSTYACIVRSSGAWCKIVQEAY